MVVINSYLEMWKRAFDFGGESQRKEFWLAFLVNAIIAGILYATGIMALYSIYCLLAIIPGIALEIRRIRDTGKSPFYIFVMFIPLAGGFMLLYNLCQPTGKYN